MSTTPHVLLVNGSLYGGGAERVIATLAHHLRDMEHRITIAAVHGGREVLNELQRDGFATIVTGAGGGSTAAVLRRAIEEHGVEVVHSHDLRSLVDAGRCRLGHRHLAHVHTFHFGNYPHLPWKHLVMEGLAARVPDLLVAVGHAQRASVETTLKLERIGMRTVWNGVDYRPVPDWSGIDREAEGLRIGSVSTFGEQKGLPTLMEAAKILRARGRRFRLVLVGEGPLRPDLEAMASSLGLADCVEFTGWRPDAATTLLPTFDIFVQSSHWEAMSVVILEAMAARRPIVATTVGENTTVLRHEASALLVPPKDAGALADALERVLADPALRRRLADTAGADYEHAFTGRAMAERYAEAYRDVLTGRPRTKARDLSTVTQAAL